MCSVGLLFGFKRMRLKVGVFVAVLMSFNKSGSGKVASYALIHNCEFGCIGGIVDMSWSSYGARTKARAFKSVRVIASTLAWPLCPLYLLHLLQFHI
ncbi:hypothetical protein VNO80_06427 [Phaseolus coccineus]|uniref:Uncharacterized protein n=1 Tax=Phaseolus coccineus TaxID=3886 RepID=A0AAN9NHQ0_PHACN